MTPRQQRFVDEYLIDLNATQAAFRAGYEFPVRPKSKPYTYFLMDPRNGQVFYVGKGRGGRVSAHAKRAAAGTEPNAPKFARMQDILAAGLSVSELIFAVHGSDEEAYAVERQLIECLRESGLTNIVGGIVTNEEMPRIKARSLLARMLPLSVWMERATPLQVNSARKLGGTPEALYVRIRSELEALAT